MLTFVLPGAAGVVSGGHLYNQRVLDALLAAGHRWDVCSLEEFRRRRCGADDVCFFDTIYLPDLAAADLAGVRAYLIVHHLASLAPEDGRTSDEVFAEDEREPLSLFQGFVATSRFTAEYLVRRGFGEADIFVAPPAPAVSAPLSRPIEDPGDAPLRVLVVANLVSRKRVLPFLEAVLEAGDVHRLRLRIVGGTTLDPAYAERCRALARDPAWDGAVEIVGQVDPTAMQAQYQWASVLVSAAEMETFGMALQEAVAFGLPIFAIDAGFVSNHVEQGVSGRVFADLASMVRGLSAYASDREARVRLERGARAHRVQGAASWSETARHFLALDP